MDVAGWNSLLVHLCHRLPRSQVGDFIEAGPCQKLWYHSHQGLKNNFIINISNPVLAIISFMHDPFIHYRFTFLFLLPFWMFGLQKTLVGTKSQLFPEIFCRRLPLSTNINFYYHPSSIHFSISFADLDILYSARSLRDLSTIQILAATPQQTRLISRRLSWEDPDLFINIHNMHIGTHTFYKYIQYWHWKYKYIWHSGWPLARTQMKLPLKFSFGYLGRLVSMFCIRPFRSLLSLRWVTIYMYYINSSAPINTDW